MLWEAVAKPGPDQDFDIMVDFGHRVGGRCLAGGGAFVAHGQHAPERCPDLRAGKLAQFDRGALDLREELVWDGWHGSSSAPPGPVVKIYKMAGLAMFLARGEISLKSRPADARDAEIGRLKEKVVDLTMANELLTAKIERLETARPLASRRPRR